MGGQKHLNSGESWTVRCSWCCEAPMAATLRLRHSDSSITMKAWQLFLAAEVCFQSKELLHRLQYQQRLCRWSTSLYWCANDLWFQPIVIVSECECSQFGCHRPWFVTARTAGEVVMFSVAVDVNSSSLVDRLTARQKKRLSFETGSPTSPRKQSVPRKRVTGPKVQKDLTVSVRRKARKLKKIRLALLSNDNKEDPSYSSSTKYWMLWNSYFENWNWDSPYFC